MSNDNMVKFLMPDGSEVSNDPRFGLDEALKKASDAIEYSGDAGITEDEQKAQTQVERPATLNSGQPGVGENSVPEDIMRDAFGPLGSPAQQIQRDDVEAANKAGADANSTSVDDDAPVDSNKAVADVREAQAKRREAARKAAEALGDENEGDGEDYMSWSAAQLKAEVTKRNADESRAEEDVLVTKGLTKKSQIAELLTADDARAAAQAPADDEDEEITDEDDDDETEADPASTESE